MTDNPFNRIPPLFRVDLNTRSLEIDSVPASMEAIANHHINHGNDLLLAVTTKYGEKYRDVPRLRRADLTIVSKLEHELDHVRRVAGTSFGQLLASLFAERVRCAFRLVDWHRDPSPDLFDVDENFDNNLQKALATQAAEFVLLADALNPESYSKELVADALNAMQGLGGGNSLELGTKPYSNIIPGIPTKRGARVLGTQALLEYLAISQEASYMGFALGRNAVPINDYQGVHMYSLVGSIWRDMYRLPMPEIKATSWTKASESLSGPRFPVEMQIAIDLALWVPFGPNGWKSGMKWHDAHPGWRFLTIMDYLQESKMEMTPFDSASAMSDDDFGALQSKWANELGWPAPNELCDEWLQGLEAVLTDHEAQIPTVRSWTIGDDSWRWRGDADYMRTKQQHPGYSVTTRPSTDGHQHLWFQLFVAEDRRREEMDLHIPPAYEKQLMGKGYRFPPAFSLNAVTEAMLTRAMNPNRRLSHRIERLTNGWLGPMFSDCRNYQARSDPR